MSDLVQMPSWISTAANIPDAIGCTADVEIASRADYAALVGNRTWVDMASAGGVTIT